MKLLNYTFSSVWADEIINYITLKEKCGFNLPRLINHFKKLDNFCIENNINSKIFTEDHCEKIKIKPDNVKHFTFYLYIFSVKLFFMNMKVKGYSVVPPKNVARNFEQHRPYIYSEDEIKRYFHAVDTYEYGKAGKMALIFPILFRLLYSCATRISEILFLKKEDVDLCSGVIKLRNTKNKHERYIVMPKDLNRLMNIFADKTFWMVEDSSYIFTFDTSKKPINARTVYRYHQEFLSIAKIKYEGSYKGPRIHDFRHTSLVLSCKKLIDLGINMHKVLPLLATWAGHETPKSTEYYLRLTVEMFPYINDKLDDMLKEILKNCEVPNEIY